MNSEILKEISQSESQQRVTIAEDTILQKAQISDEFMSHAGWRLVVSELESVKKKANQELLNVAVCDNLTKVQARRYLINAIDLFIESPKKFINQRIMIQSRRKRNA
jgi:5-deoxy-D-glucuronate isomerase